MKYATDCEESLRKSLQDITTPLTQQIESLTAALTAETDRANAAERRADAAERRADAAEKRAEIAESNSQRLSSIHLQIMGLMKDKFPSLHTEFLTFQAEQQ